MEYDVLVNRNNKIPYHNFKLVNISTRVLPTLAENVDTMLEEQTYIMWLKLIKKAKLAGFDFEIVSGYRTFEYQQKILEYYIEELGFDLAIKRVAIPNYSEHQTGLAIDFCYYRDIIINNISEKKAVEVIQESDLEYIWLLENMSDFGFILRYPKDKTAITDYSYEPWHIRYVGVELAKYINENNLTLEEYHQKKLLK